MTRGGHQLNPRRGVRTRMPLALGLASLIASACNSILGISTPVDRPPDAADVLVLVDAGADGADARPESHDAGPDSGDAALDGADTGPDGADAGTNTDASDANPPSLVITPTTLPDARFNVPYSVTFTATGGSGAEQRWTMVSGALPPGLDLELDGTLHGVPVQEGTFEIGVMVSELPPGTAIQAVQIALKVIRKFWLAYLANPEQADSFGVYAIDVRNPYVQMKVSSNVEATVGAVTQFDFSPDGQYIAYIGSQAQGAELYVVDMTGNQPGTPRKVNEYGNVNDFAWSADGRYLAFIDTDALGTNAVLVADMTQPLAHPVQAATGSGLTDGIGFVTDDLLTYWFDTLAFTQRGTDGKFGAAQLLTSFGSLVQRWPDLESGLFVSADDGCQTPTWNLIDFHTPLTTRQLTGYVSVSPGRDFIAHRENPDYQYLIYSTWGTDPLTTFSTSSRNCSPGGWSHDGSLFVTGGDGDTLQITRINGSTATTSALPGSYGTVAESWAPAFSPDDHWLGFSTDQGVFVVKNDHGTLGAAIGGGLPVNAPFGDPQLAFSPDSNFLVSGEPSSTDRAASIRLTDLRRSPPTALDYSLGTTAGSAVFSLGWSIDSSLLALIVRDGAYPTPTDLYISFHSVYSSVNVTNFPPCLVDSSACRSVSNIEFQP